MTQLHSAEDAIKQAVGAGWLPRFFDTKDLVDSNGDWIGIENSRVMNMAECLQDPLMWQALGKARGWRESPYLCPGCDTIGRGKYNHMRDCPIKDRVENWQIYAQLWFRTLLSSGDMKKFWEGLP